MYMWLIKHEHQYNSTDIELLLRFAIKIKLKEAASITIKATRLPFLSFQRGSFSVCRFRWSIDVGHTTDDGIV